MKQALCVHLPHWPIDRLRRCHTELRRSPLILTAPLGGRQMVVYVSPDVPPALRPGMTLTEAKARAPGIIHLPATPQDDWRALQALGRWMMRFSPSVCLYPLLTPSPGTPGEGWGEGLPFSSRITPNPHPNPLPAYRERGPEGLFLDATGLDRLFAGLPNLRRHVSQSLATLHITATVAIAPTPGAAWAIAAFARHPSGVIEPDQVLKVISPLPVAALRLNAPAVTTLSALGIHTIAQLLRLSRDELAVRFGVADDSILRRIDQATGAAPEPLPWLQHRSPIRAEIEFDGVIESLESILLAVRQLTADITAQLTRGGLGALELRLSLRRPYAPPTEKTVRLTRPSRRPDQLFKLLTCALETLDIGDGLLALHLSVPKTEPLPHEAPLLLGNEQTQTESEWSDLVARLQARLDHPLEWAELLESHIPELAFTTAPALPKSTCPPCAPIQSPRPLHLLPCPRPIGVIVTPSESREGKPVHFTDLGRAHRLPRVRGPERVSGQWWNGRWKTRDYFDALDSAGRRFWLFRVLETGLWYLHGIFE